MKGVVISGDDGQPLIGATVVIKGSKSGVLTDIDGKFSIENVSNKSLLQFSYIGMKPQDLTPAPNMNTFACLEGPLIVIVINWSSILYSSGLLAKIISRVCSILLSLTEPETVY